MTNENVQPETNNSNHRSHAVKVNWAWIIFFVILVYSSVLIWRGYTVGTTRANTANAKQVQHDLGVLKAAGVKVDARIVTLLTASDKPAKK